MKAATTFHTEGDEFNRRCGRERHFRHHLHDRPRTHGFPAFWCRLMLWPEQACFLAVRQIDGEIGVCGGGRFGNRRERRDIARIMACESVAERKIGLRSGERIPNWIIECVLHVVCSAATRQT
jgi:hypothetical protein